MCCCDLVVTVTQLRIRPLNVSLTVKPQTKQATDYLKVEARLLVLVQWVVSVAIYNNYQILLKTKQSYLLFVKNSTKVLQAIFVNYVKYK